MVHPYDERKASYSVFRSLYFDLYGEDFPRVAFCLGDRGRSDGHYSMCFRADDPFSRSYCGPDWTWIHWPSAGVFDSMGCFSDIMDAGGFAPELDRVGWYGNALSAGSDVEEGFTRGRLVGHFASLYPGRFHFFHSVGSGRISMPGLVRRYRHLLDIGGDGYSGRLKFLLFSGRPLLLVERPFVEYFHSGLVPWEHYIPVRRDLSDLVERHSWLLDNDSDALRIAGRAREFALEHFGLDVVLGRMREVFSFLVSSGCVLEG